MIAPRTRRPVLARPIALGAIALLALSLSACDKVALTAPTNSTIRLFTNTTVLPLNGTAEVIATVTESSGTAVQNGTQVTFTTTVGTLDPAEARTKDGKASVRLGAGLISGTARVRAFSGGAQSEELEVKIGGSAAARVLLNVSPATVPVGGGTVQLVATVVDADGNRLPGVPVTFNTTAGTLSAATQLTDNNGEARVSLTTSRDASVSASAGAVEAARVEIRVSTAPVVTISAPSAAIQVGQTATFTVNVSASANSSPIREVTIDFGDGTRESLGALSGSIAVQHVFRDAGLFLVSVTARDVNDAHTTVSTTVNVLRQAPIIVSVIASPSSSVEPRVGNPVTITVTVSSATPILRYEYDFGDGATAVLTSGTTTHVYNTTGAKVITVRVVAVDGASGVGRAEVNVRP
jgi:hypothetical protein